MLPTHRPPTHPGEMLLKEFLEPLGVSQVEAATRMSIPFQRLNGIVNGRRAVSAGTALRRIRLLCPRLAAKTVVGPAQIRQHG